MHCELYDTMRIVFFFSSKVGFAVKKRDFRFIDVYGVAFLVGDRTIIKYKKRYLNFLSSGPSGHKTLFIFQFCFWESFKLRNDLFRPHHVLGRISCFKRKPFLLYFFLWATLANGVDCDAIFLVVLSLASPFLILFPSLRKLICGARGKKSWLLQGVVSSVRETS